MVDNLMPALEQQLGILSEKTAEILQRDKNQNRSLRNGIQQLPIRNIHDQAFDQRERELQELSHRIEELYEYTKSLQKQQKSDPFFTPPPKIYPSLLPSSQPHKPSPLLPPILPPKTTFFGEGSRASRENPKRKEVVESAFISPNQPLQNPKSPEPEPSPKKTQTSNVNPDIEPLSQAMITSHTYQEPTDSDDHCRSFCRSP